MLFRRVANATVDTMTKHLASSMREGGVLHQTIFYRSVVKFGQRYFPNPVSDEKAMEAGAKLLVCYTLAGSSFIGMVYQVKNYFDWRKDFTLETKQCTQASQLEVEQATEQLRQQIQSLRQDMRDKTDVAQAETMDDDTIS